jgi:hypothetical protein
MIRSHQDQDWSKHFPIQSAVDLDFVVGQGRAWPVGMQRRSPAEFRRRILAAATSYVLQVKSIDYTLRRYVKPDQYQNDDELLGDIVSDFIKSGAESVRVGLRALHTAEPGFGRVGSEITLYKFPDVIDVARMLANRGLFLEVIPILRLAVEMTGWAICVHNSEDENYVANLKAQSCLSALKRIYPSAGRVYGYVSKFSHWEQAIHPFFLNIEENVGLIRASCKYRAISSALCLVILDIFLEAVRCLYGAQAESLITAVQGIAEREATRAVSRLLDRVAETTSDEDIVEVRALLS